MMTTSGLATPPRPAARPAERPRPDRPPDRRSDGPERPSFERVLLWSLALSVVLHLLFVLLSPLFIQTIHPPGGTAAPVLTSDRVFGMEAIVAIPSADAPETPAVDRPEPVEVERTAPRVQPVSPATPTPAGAAPDRAPANPDQPASVGDALRPGYRDPRLYIRPSPFVPDRRTPLERYQEQFQARIDAINDSMGVASARNRTTSDWTTTDSEGRRWGLSPEGLHLGGITVPRALLPLPGATGDNASLEEERERQRQREEIQRQEADRERRETERERIEATREERDRQRAEGGS